MPRKRLWRKWLRSDGTSLHEGGGRRKEAAPRAVGGSEKQEWVSRDDALMVRSSGLRTRTEIRAAP